MNIRLMCALSLALPACGRVPELSPLTGVSITRIQGTSELEEANYRFVGANGVAVSPLQVNVRGEQYDGVLPGRTYANLRVVAQRNAAVVSKIVWREPPQEERPPELALLADETYTGPDYTLDTESQSTTLLIDAYMSTTRNQSQRFDLATIDPTIIRRFYREFGASYEDAGPAQGFRQMVARVVAVAREDASGHHAFRAPVVDFLPSSGRYVLVQSAIDEDWLETAPIDFDADGTRDVTSAVFDAAMIAAMIAYDGMPRLGACIDHSYLRVVFEVDMNPGRKDGNCQDINRFRWVNDDLGKRMFFVGGIHSDSVFQDPQIDLRLGGWRPNHIMMYDDGTNGDEVAGDQIWSLALTLPRGAEDESGRFVPLRIGYKYTWGFEDQHFPGTEEWPGNQRLLEVVDVNGDNIIRRRDHFGDEASNNDFANLRQGTNGRLTWDTDVNGDGIMEVHEQPLDVDLDCQPDRFVSPQIGPALVDCAW